MKVLLTYAGTIIDFDFDLLKELCVLLDSQLDHLDTAASESPDPDGFGIFDSIDHVSGLGFAACQQYISSIAGLAGIPKHRAIECPPIHSSGHPVVALVNAAANHWKHSSEWSEPPDKQAVRTLKVLASLDVDVEREHLIWNALYKIVCPERARFGNLLPLLIKWRDELVAAK